MSSGVVLRPFRGLRYDPRQVDMGAVTTEPLEPSDTVRVAAALAGDEHNIAWLLDPLLAGSQSPDAAAGVARRLAAWRGTGAVRQDETPSVYVYGRQTGGRRLLGLIAALSLHEPDEDRVLPHEEVSDAAVARHVALLKASSAQPEPVVLVQRASDPFRAALDDIVERQATVAFRDGATEHRLWRVSDPNTISTFADGVADQRLLIADGHHRYAAFRRYRDAHRHLGVGPWTYGLAMLVDTGRDGATVDPIHRVVPGIGWETVRRTPGLQTRPLPDGAAAAAFLATSTGAPGRCVITDGNTWLAAVTDDAHIRADDPSTLLAVTHLHRSWTTAWGIGETATDYVQEPVRAVDYARRSGGLAVLLPAPPLTVVRDAALRGRLLPPKATSFGPKPRIGLVLRHWPGGLDDLHGERAPEPVRADAAGAAPG
jgi:uncharacterized protein (DUF1015 family)